MIQKNEKIKHFSNYLRTNMTPEEKHLWYDFLKRLPVTVKRQYVIGNYIVDFLIFSKKMIIEIDGRQHGLPENKEADIERDEKLRQMGFTVFRYTNEQINTNFRGVAADILNHLGLTMSDLKKETYGYRRVLKNY